MSVIKSRKFCFSPLFLTLFLLSYIFCIPVSWTADGDSYFGADFKKSLAMFNANAAFKLDDSIRYNSSTQKDAYIEAKARNYDRFARQACEPLMESFVNAIGAGLKGEEAYQFSEQLLQEMRSIGAYPLPIRLVENGKVDIEYFNPHQTAPDMPNKEFIELMNGKGIQWPSAKSLPGGIYQFDKDYRRTSDFVHFHQFATTEAQFELKKFGYEFDVAQPFLLILDSNPSDIAAETLYIYFDFAFQIASDSKTKVGLLQTTSEVEQHLRCVTISEAGLITHTRMLEHGQKKQTKALGKDVPPPVLRSAVYEFEPLMIPIYKEYEVGKIEINEEGEKTKNPYLLQSQDISEPSLHCWLTSLDFSQGNPDSCRNGSYNQEFLEMLNKGVCVGSSGTIGKTGEYTYPVKINKPGKLIRPSNSGEKDICNFK